MSGSLLRYGPTKPIRGISRARNSVRRSNFVPRGTCEQCGEPRPDRSNIDGRYCGRICAALAARHVVPSTCHVCGVVIGRSAVACNRHRHARRQQARQRQCARCGTTFAPSLSVLARGAGKYCSLACYREVQHQRLAMVALQCPQCGQGFRRTQGAVKRAKVSYCSLRCATTAHSGEHNSQWRGGSNPNRGKGWCKIAERIRERDGYRCRRCGKTQDENGQKLSVDHVIPWRAFESAEEANQSANLVSLCRPCHSRKSRAERLWLKGDVLDMWRYQVAVAQPWTNR